MNLLLQHQDKIPAHPHLVVLIASVENIMAKQLAHAHHLISVLLPIVAPNALLMMIVLATLHALIRNVETLAQTRADLMQSVMLLIIRLSANA